MKDEPAFDELLEFVLAGDVAAHEDEMIVVEVWDYRYFNHFKVVSSHRFSKLSGRSTAPSVHLHRWPEFELM